MKLDDALLMLGAHGRYQVVVYFMISTFDNFLSIWHMSVMAFLGYEQTHHCKIQDGAMINESIPPVSQDDPTILDKCFMYDFDETTGKYSNETVPCQNGWTYSRTPIETSIVSEWDLVCDKNWLPETSTMIFNIGVMVGGLVFGFFSDKFGRKWCFISACILQAVVGTAAGFANSFALFTALRFVVGALEQGVNITGFIMATELFPPKERTVYSVAHEFLWAIGGAFLPMFAYFIRQWRHLQIVVSAPGIFAIFLIWTIPESVVWLKSKGRVKEAEEILQRAAKWNGRVLPNNCLSEAEGKTMLDADMTSHNDPVKAQKTFTVIDLFKTPNLRKITFCVCGLWALNTMVYYGLSYNTPNLYGDMYLNFFLGQMVEIPSVACTMLAMYKIGRRWPLCLFHILAGAVCIASPFIPKETESGVSLAWASVTLAMVGKFAINASFTIIYVYGPEIYPTVLRNTGSGLASTSGRIGGILFPYINYLSKLNTPHAKKLPLIVFGVISIVGGFLALPLPETKNRPLPETIEDVEFYDEFCSRAPNSNGNISVTTSDAEDRDEERTENDTTL